MPYFHTDDINVLFIHVPKTGGSSIEKYFSEKFDINMDYTSLYGWKHPAVVDSILFGDNKYEYSLQHMHFRQYIKFQRLFGINMCDPTLIVLAIVRNPYERIVSDMFFFVKELNITIISTPDDVEKAIETYLITETSFDNHRMTQYDMLRDDNGFIPPRMNIMRTDTLTSDMHFMGFDDFNLCENSNRAGVSSDHYMSLLTRRSILLINNYYAKDFDYFGYELW